MAGSAFEAGTAVPADSHALPGFPLVHFGAEFIDLSDDLMSGNPGVANAGEPAFFYNCIAMADAAELNLDTDFGFPGFGEVFLNQFKFRAGRGYLHGFH